MTEHEPTPEQQEYLDRHTWIENMTERYAIAEGALEKPDRVEIIRSWIEGQYIDAEEQGYTDVWKQHMQDFLERKNSRR